jgi:hypothetical protein
VKLILHTVIVRHMIGRLTLAVLRITNLDLSDSQHGSFKLPYIKVMGCTVNITAGWY